MKHELVNCTVNDICLLTTPYYNSVTIVCPLTPILLIKGLFRTHLRPADSYKRNPPSLKVIPSPGSLIYYNSDFDE